ncbi:MAG: ABC transporter substrate-binding protein [Acholeplasmatales bacterium]|nr:ABC transporter substrate-binding protein [Acholeplasmatales bacterium]
MKRKLISAFSLLSLPFVFSLTSCKQTSEGGDLKIFNAGEYLDPDLLEAFEKEYNCKVNYSTFESNEAAVTKMQTESYDLVIPSDYSVDELAKAGMLKEIDWDKINFSKEDMSDSLVSTLDRLNSGNDPLDLLKYGVPYFYGIVGIVYNANIVDEEDLEEGWNILKNPKYKGKVAYYDNPRDGFIAPLKTLGYSLNTNSSEEVDEAFNWILDMKGKTNPAYKTDELLSEMPQGKYALGLMYSGDALYAISLEDEDVDLRFFVPEEGSDLFIDSMVIPTSCKNEEMAYNFINFISSYDNAYQNSSYVGYTSPIKEVYQDIIAEDGDYYEDAIYYEVRDNKNDEVYRYNKDLKIKFNDYFVKLKLY